MQVIDSGEGCAPYTDTVELVRRSQRVSVDEVQQLKQSFSLAQCFPTTNSAGVLDAVLRALPAVVQRSDSRSSLSTDLLDVYQRYAVRVWPRRPWSHVAALLRATLAHFPASPSPIVISYVMQGVAAVARTTSSPGAWASAFPPVRATADAQSSLWGLTILPPHLSNPTPSSALPADSAAVTDPASPAQPPRARVRIVATTDALRQSPAEAAGALSGWCESCGRSPAVAALRDAMPAVATFYSNPEPLDAPTASTRAAACAASVGAGVGGGGGGGATAPMVGSGVPVYQSSRVAVERAAAAVVVASVPSVPVGLLAPPATAACANTSVAVGIALCAACPGVADVALLGVLQRNREVFDGDAQAGGAATCVLIDAALSLVAPSQRAAVAQGVAARAEGLTMGAVVTLLAKGYDVQRPVAGDGAVGGRGGGLKGRKGGASAVVEEDAAALRAAGGAMGEDSGDDDFAEDDPHFGTVGAELSALAPLVAQAAAEKVVSATTVVELTGAVAAWRALCVSVGDAAAGALLLPALKTFATTLINGQPPVLSRSVEVSGERRGRGVSTKTESGRDRSSTPSRRERSSTPSRRGKRDSASSRTTAQLPAVLERRVCECFRLGARAAVTRGAITGDDVAPLVAEARSDAAAAAVVAAVVALWKNSLFVPTVPRVRLAIQSALSLPSTSTSTWFTTSGSKLDTDAATARALSRFLSAAVSTAVAASTRVAPGSSGTVGFPAGLTLYSAAAAPWAAQVVGAALQDTRLSVDPPVLARAVVMMSRRFEVAKWELRASAARRAAQKKLQQAAEEARKEEERKERKEKEKAERKQRERDGKGKEGKERSKVRADGGRRESGEERLRSGRSRSEQEKGETKGSSSRRSRGGGEVVVGGPSVGKAVGGGGADGLRWESFADGLASAAARSVLAAVEVFEAVADEAPHEGREAKGEHRDSRSDKRGTERGSRKESRGNRVRGEIMCSSDERSSVLAPFLSDASRLVCEDAVPLLHAARLCAQYDGTVDASARLFIAALRSARCSSEVLQIVSTAAPATITTALELILSTTRVCVETTGSAAVVEAESPPSESDEPNGVATFTPGSPAPRRPLKLMSPHASSASATSAFKKVVEAVLKAVECAARDRVAAAAAAATAKDSSRSSKTKSSEDMKDNAKDEKHSSRDRKEADRKARTSSSSLRDAPRTKDIARAVPPLPNVRIAAAALAAATTCVVGTQATFPRSAVKSESTRSSGADDKAAGHILPSVPTTATDAVAGSVQSLVIAARCVDAIACVHVVLAWLRIAQGEVEVADELEEAERVAVKARTTLLSLCTVAQCAPIIDAAHASAVVAEAGVTATVASAPFYARLRGMSSSYVRQLTSLAVMTRVYGGEELRVPRTLREESRTADAAVSGGSPSKAKEEGKGGKGGAMTASVGVMDRLAAAYTGGWAVLSGCAGGWESAGVILLRAASAAFTSKSRIEIDPSVSFRYMIGLEGPRQTPAAAAPAVAITADAAAALDQKKLASEEVVGEKGKASRAPRAPLRYPPHRAVVVTDATWNCVACAVKVADEAVVLADALPRPPTVRPERNSTDVRTKKRDRSGSVASRRSAASRARSSSSDSDGNRSGVGKSDAAGERSAKRAPPGGDGRGGDGAGGAGGRAGKSAGATGAAAVQAHRSALLNAFSVEAVTAAIKLAARVSCAPAMLCPTLDLAALRMRHAAHGRPRSTAQPSDTATSGSGCGVNEDAASALTECVLLGRLSSTAANVIAASSSPFVIACLQALLPPPHNAKGKGKRVEGAPSWFAPSAAAAIVSALPRRAAAALGDRLPILTQLCVSLSAPVGAGGCAATALWLEVAASVLEARPVMRAPHGGGVAGFAAGGAGGGGGSSAGALILPVFHDFVRRAVAAAAAVMVVARSHGLSPAYLSECKPIAAALSVVVSSADAVAAASLSVSETLGEGGERGSGAAGAAGSGGRSGDGAVSVGGGGSWHGTKTGELEAVWVSAFTHCAFAAAASLDRTSFQSICDAARKVARGVALSLGSSPDAFLAPSPTALLVDTAVGLARAVAAAPLGPLRAESTAADLSQRRLCVTALATIFGVLGKAVVVPVVGGRVNEAARPLVAEAMHMVPKRRR